jgi:hypothetical protein
MTKLAWIVVLGLSSFPAADPELQPECRTRCEQAYAEELAACEGAERVDVCRDEAQDRYQECIDRCND